MSDTSANPYVGPRMFELEDADRFFGRDREARDVLSIVIAEPLVLFYAPSGAGKSSLINARLIPGLEEQDFHVLPVGRVSGAPVGELEHAGNVYTFNLLASINPPDSAVEGLQGMSLYSYLQSRREGLDDPDQPLVLIVDQFEELVTTYHGRWYERKAFFRQLDEALKNDPLLWVILAAREDYVTALRPYATGMNSQRLTQYQMQRLRFPAALQAVKRPAADHGRPFAAGVAEDLVDNLRQIRTQEIEDNRRGEYVEPVQLQVVCYQLWENLKEQPLGEITAADVEQLGDVDRALGDFYNRTLAEVLDRNPHLGELKLRTWFERQLITVDHTRGTVYQGTEETAGLPNEAVRQLADRYLLRSEIRAGGAWFELVHDRLVAPILQCNELWRAQQGPELAAAILWDEQGRTPDHLLEGAQLKDALSRMEQGPSEPLVREFLVTSETAEREREEERALQLATAKAEASRLRRYIVALAIVVGIGIVLLYFAVAGYLQVREDERRYSELLGQHVALNNEVATAGAVQAAAAIKATEAVKADTNAQATINAGASEEEARSAISTAEAAAYDANLALARALAASDNANATATRLAAAAEEIGYVSPWTPELLAEKEIDDGIALDVPYRSQWDADASANLADDGPTVLAMVLNALGVDLTPDGANQFLPDKARNRQATFDELATAATEGGVSNEYAEYDNADDALAQLRRNIENGFPLIIGVDLTPWADSVGSIGQTKHYVLVVGYDDDYIYLHDPQFGRGQPRSAGAFLKLPKELFLDGWGRFGDEANPSWAALIPATPAKRLVLAGPNNAPAGPKDSGAVLLDVPYRSQWADDATSHTADDGPSALAMLLNANGVDITPDGVYDYLPPKSASDFTSIGELMQAASSNGLEMTYMREDGAAEALARLRSSIDEGKPFIALIKYEPWRELTGNDFKWGHFVLVVGYDEDSVYMHDSIFGLWVKPASKGAYFKMTTEQFLAGWGGFPVNENPNWAAIYPTEPVAPFVEPDAASQVTVTRAAESGSIIHTVVSGDTLASVSRAYGVSIEELKTANDLDRDFLWVGESLQIPSLGRPQSLTPAASPSVIP